jgi:hypothetical protein
MHNTLVCSLARRERVGLSPAPHFLPCSRPHAYHPFPDRSSLLFTGFWVSPLSFLWKVLGWRVLVLFGLVSFWSSWSIIGRSSGLSGAPHPAEGGPTRGRGSWRKWSSARSGTGKTRSRGLRKVPEGHLWQRGVEALATQAELFGDVRERVRQLQRRAEDSLRTGMRANLVPALASEPVSASRP